MSHAVHFQLMTKIVELQYIKWSSIVKTLNRECTYSYPCQTIPYFSNPRCSNAVSPSLIVPSPIAPSNQSVVLDLLQRMAYSGGSQHQHSANCDTNLKISGIYHYHTSFQFLPGGKKNGAKKWPNLVKRGQNELHIFFWKTSLKVA